MRPEVGDSHFYSASPAECCDNRSALRRIVDLRESERVLHPAAEHDAPVPARRHPPDLALPQLGLNIGNTNHRYTAEVAVRDDLRNKPWWTPEGYGADAVIMCSPES